MASVVKADNFSNINIQRCKADFLGILCKAQIFLNEHDDIPDSWILFYTQIADLEKPN